MNKEIIISVNPGFNRYNIDLLSIENICRKWSGNVINFEDMVCLTANKYKLTISNTGHLELFTQSTEALSSALLDLSIKILPEIYKFISESEEFYKIKIFWNRSADDEYVDEKRIVSIISGLPISNEKFIRTTTLLRPETYCTSFISSTKH